MRAPRTNRPTLEIKGRIPSWMLSRLKREFGKNLIVKDDSGPDEELVDVFSTPWFASVQSKMKPGDSIRIYRENAGLSQAELGTALGNIPRQNVSAMEKGRRGISKEVAKKLSRVLNARVERFL